MYYLGFQIINLNVLSSNQISEFFDHQYLCNETFYVFFHIDIYQGTGQELLLK